jgi:two-component system, OmpR family, sensor kinase
VRTDGPAAVHGDPVPAAQVLANLLRNALVHTPGGTAIEVSVRRAGGEVVLDVRDHGPGLPGDDPDALFERFWRAEGGRERGKGGAGLGLAIVAAIVSAHDGRVHAENVTADDGQVHAENVMAHDGRVRAENAAGGGARFTVALPAAGDGGAAAGDAAGRTALP